MIIFMYYSCIQDHFRRILLPDRACFLLDSMKPAIGATEAEGSMFQEPYDVTENASQNQPHSYHHWTFNLIQGLQKKGKTFYLTLLLMIAMHWQVEFPVMNE